LLTNARREVVVLERADAVGASWRERYEGLRLNTIRFLSDLPAYRMARRYGRYPRREDYVSYLEDYAAHFGLEVRFGTTAVRVERREGGWDVATSAGQLLAQNVVVATGYDAVPVMPHWPGREAYSETVIHSSSYRSPHQYTGKEVLVVGAGVSGVDIAGHLAAAGAKVALSLRAFPNIFPRDWLGIPLQPNAFLTERLPARFGDIAGFALQRALWGDLTRHGLPRPAAGFETAYRKSLRFSPVDDGFVAALKAGRARVVAGVERFEAAGVVLVGGARLSPDAIICATGFSRGLDGLVGHLGVLRGDGAPRYDRGVPSDPSVPGLWFVGFYPRNSGHLYETRAQALRVARAIAGRKPAL
jgi:putative flavoprotein involved in K+ transport